MNRDPVKSSNIKSIGYSSESRILEIEFHKGGLYQYSGVPIAEYNGLMSAGSHGKYFHRNIRNKFSYTKIR